MSGSTRDALLRSIERRILWLAVNIVHHANHVRPNVDGMKVGGHQSSSASVATIMTALYFDYLRPGDKVSIKPHASPVFHAVQYLLGNLEAHHVTTLRELHGLQSYPSRTKDPDAVDFSTGSVGLGCIAPNFAALADAYLQTHALAAPDARRFVSVLGDAELDEGSVWEAIAEPALQGLERVRWIVDLNRQSLDRVIPGIRVRCWREMFAANGWTVIDVKYGERLERAFALPNGELLRACIDELSNAAYQRLLRQSGAVLREWLPAKSRAPRDLQRFLSRWNDDELRDLFGNLGGHDFSALRTAFARAERSDGPAVLFAYTLKGCGLPTVGHPRNHAALLTPAQVRLLQQQLGIPEGEEWAAFSPASEEGRLCSENAGRLRVSGEQSLAGPPAVPASVGCVHVGLRSTQQAFGTVLTAFGRECPELARRVVTMSPDVASSTNLGGWINKHGVWLRQGNEEPLPPETEQSGIHWHEGASGQHLELGISENNLFMALGQFGLTRELFGELLVPIGTLYDPFVRRGLDAFFYSAYAGAKFMVVGTPSGLTLAPEGGAHQSLGSQSIGTEMPEIDAYEPCFGQELEWIFLHGIEQIVARGRSTYLRLSTRAVDQAVFAALYQDARRAVLRHAVLAGAYRLIDRSVEPEYDPRRNVVNIFAAGAVLPEAIAASDELHAVGIHANVFNVTGPGPLYRDYQAARAFGGESHVETLLAAAERPAPIVTLVDDHPHALAWLGGALATRCHPLGVSSFGQSGNRVDLYREYGIDAAHVVAACRQALKRFPSASRRVANAR